jgi:hypothetical protein
LRRRSAAAASRWTWIGVTKAACRVNEAGQAQHQRILHRPLAVPHRGKCLGCHENLHEPESRNIAKMNTWAIQRPMRKPLPADGLEVAVMAVPWLGRVVAHTPSLEREDVEVPLWSDQKRHRSAGGRASAARRLDLMRSRLKALNDGLEGQLGVAISCCSFAVALAGADSQSPSSERIWQAVVWCGFSFPRLTKGSTRST